MKSLKKQTFVLMIITVVSKIVALGREILLAVLFGTTWILDSYISGTALSNFFLHYLVGGRLFLFMLVGLFNQKMKTID